MKTAFDNEYALECCDAICPTRDLYFTTFYVEHLRIFEAISHKIRSSLMFFGTSSRFEIKNRLNNYIK